MAFDLENKSADMSETRKDRGCLLWTAYRNSPTLFRTVPSPTPYAGRGWYRRYISLCGIARDRPNIWVPPINSGTGKAIYGLLI